MPKATGKTDQKEFMVRYLLDEVSPEERESFEERYASDRDLFEELVAFENDMVDSYASGSLSEAEQKRFESRYLTTPQRHQRVNFAKSLLSYSSPSPVSQFEEERASAPAPVKAQKEPGRAWFSLAGFFQLHARAAAFAFVAIFAAGLWLLAINMRLRHELRDSEAEQARLLHDAQEISARVKILTEQLQDVSAHNDQQAPPQQQQNVEIAELVLSPGLARSGDEQHILSASSAALSAQLQLKLDRREYASYEVSLETPEETAIYQSKALKSQVSQGHGKVLLFSLPLSKLLNNEYYIVRLSGTGSDGSVQSVDEYSFRFKRVTKNR